MHLAPKTVLSVALAAAIGFPACASDEATSSDVQGSTEITIDATAKDGGQVEVYRSDADDQYYLRLQAGNGEIVLRGEGYESLGGIRNATQSLKRNGQLSKAYELRKADNGEHYFVVKAGNGRIIGVSETYTRKSSAIQGANGVAAYLKGTTMVDYWTDQCGFEMYVGADDDYWFRLRARNGEKLLKSEGYASEQGAKTAIDTVVTTTLIAADNEDSGWDDVPAFVVFQGQDDQFYWRLVAANHEIVATGGEGFATAAAAEASIELVKQHANEEIACWTNDVPQVLEAGSNPHGDLMGTVQDTFIGEMDPFVVGDVCVMFVKPYGGERWVGLLEEDSWCEYTMTYTELHGFAVAVAKDDMIPVSAAEDAELQDYQQADYFWLDGPVDSIE